MSSDSGSNRPTHNQVRVVEHDGRRWLQQWRNKPGGHLWEFEWVDIAELAPIPSNVRSLHPKL